MREAGSLSYMKSLEDRRSPAGSVIPAQYHAPMSIRMISHPTGGEYGDGATDRLRDLTQRQNRQRDSRERPAICRTA